jgi:hypothetical protein
MNHWWHVPFYVSARGLTTFSIPFGNRSFEMEFDLLEHMLVLRTSEGVVRKTSLEKTSVAEFYAKVLNELAAIELPIRIFPRPFDPERCGSDIPFARDTTHASYDREPVERFWRILTFAEGVLREFRGRFLGKCSPVHFFWHSFDLAVTRFSGRPAPIPTDADPVTRDAYSHEVISAGFWPGDDNLPEPAFYTYVHPEPAELTEARLEPESTWWQAQNGGSMALLKYEDVRTAQDPREDLLRFLQSAYSAGAERAEWPDDLDLYRG